MTRVPPPAAGRWGRSGWFEALGGGWSLTVGLLLGVVALPVVAVVLRALGPGDSIWPHLVETVLPDALTQTALLALGTSLATLVVGTATAWLVTMYRFPGRSLIDRLLILPLAMPTYIVAYCFAEIFDYAGPVQSGLRHAFGWTAPAHYWFPEIRSLGGATFVMTAVLYPYVYLSARASFVQQSVCVLEVARTLGRTAAGTFWSVALPLARPALAAGVSLALMEVMNDLGAVQYLGVETLSASIYATWMQRSNLAGAAQLATVMLLVIAAIVLAERALRGGARVHHTTGRYRAIAFEELRGWRGWLAAVLCLVPFAVGFVLPVCVLARHALSHSAEALEGGLVQAAWNSLSLSALAAAVAVLIALVIVYAKRVAATPFLRFAARFAGLGYAVPGTVLAIGILFPLAAIDNRVDAFMSSTFGISTGLLLSGSVFAIALAYVIRFLAVALGAIEAGFDRVSPNLDSAARTLGETALSALRRVHLPLLAPALGAAALLVFVDAMKELPATLLLRPFDYETLATQIYAFAALERIEAGALGALAIVAVGVVPLLMLHRVIAGGRAGSRTSSDQLPRASSTQAS